MEFGIRLGKEELTFMIKNDIKKNQFHICDDFYKLSFIV